MTRSLTEAVDDLREFVLNHFDGSVSRCLDLDELLWRVRLANRHEPEMYHVNGPTARPMNSGPAVNAKFLEELDLEDLGL